MLLHCDGYGRSNFHFITGKDSNYSRMSSKILPFTWEDLLDIHRHLRLKHPFFNVTVHGKLPKPSDDAIHQAAHPACMKYKKPEFCKVEGCVEKSAVFKTSQDIYASSTALQGINMKGKSTPYATPNLLQY